VNIQPYLEFLPAALGRTAFLTVVSLVVGLALGLLIGIARVSHIKVLRACATAYIEVIRGIPLVVLILYLYYGLGMFVGRFWVASPYFYAVAAFGLCYAAYIAEIFRAGFQSLDRGQGEAARALGLSRGQSMRHVLLPQAFRNILPALGNEGVALLKDTSLASAITIPEITLAGKSYASFSYRFFEVWTVIALCYLALTLPLTWGVRRLEARLGVRGTSHTA
jgi:polar amino acid transport system permease protein